MLATLLSAALAASLMTDEAYPRGQTPPEAARAIAPAPPRPVLSLPIARLTSPNQDDRPAGAVIDTLIIHDTESPGILKARTIGNYFLNPKSGVSAHYIIGKAGEVLQCVPDEKRAWHAGPSKFEGREKVNDFSIGIELVNAQSGHDPFTDAQYASLIALSADLIQRYNIPLTHITGHRNITNYPELKKDPADNFDWERYLVGVQTTLASRQVVRVTASGGGGGR